jgi:hypothetical protein
MTWLDQLNDVEGNVLRIVAAMVALVLAIGSVYIAFIVGKSAWFRIGPTLANKIVSDNFSDVRVLEWDEEAPDWDAAERYPDSYDEWERRS